MPVGLIEHVTCMGCLANIALGCPWHDIEKADEVIHAKYSTDNSIISTRTCRCLARPNNEWWTMPWDYRVS